MKPVATLSVVLALAVAGCASSTVTLLNGEGTNPVGAVAVLDPKTGDDVRVIDTAGTSVAVDGASARVRSTDAAAAEARYAALLAGLPEPPVRFILYFPEGSTNITPESVIVRDALFAEIKRRGPGVAVQIEGHTDRVGDAADNVILSKRRADAARDMLVGLGLDTDITRTVGRGERAPLPGHATADNVEDPANRRVEVVVR
jgi:outer membrane protein OmpA-like peptidoglycan-associated protein